ncbi:hypothetical protein AB2B41_20980 [Marimonas sp. MJW-29]|uniref:Uncharacterized protein n=1 Tax=Sulfitobacter sediminis TaxID=3234186 RepID=A0ABV3RSV9_9RHOB
MTEQKPNPTIQILCEEWTELLDQEEAAFQEICRLDAEGPEKSKAKSEAVRHWWMAVNAVLWMFTRTRLQYDYELQPFPQYVFARLADISEEISTGIVPKIIEYARIGGRPLYLLERHHIAYGVLYIEAVSRGDIADRSPNKTVRTAYNVTAKAVQGWMKRRDEICLGVPFKSLSPEKLKEKMLHCGSVYSHIGRGAPSEN